MHGMTDIHSHILPGVDDGAKDLQEAARMCALAAEEGIRTIVVTPHYHLGAQAADNSRRDHALEMLEAEMERRGFHLQFYRGNEIYYSTQAIDDLKAGKARTMGSSKYALIEFSPGAEYSYIRQGLNHVIQEGYLPIVAHVERYKAIIEDKSRIREITEMGSYIQINASGVMGMSGRKIKAFCKEILSEGLVHFIGTDAHDMNNRAPRLKKCADYIEKKFGAAYAKRLFIDNPQKMLWDEYL
ncbi:MAG: hypothetical protein HDR00_05740 [Lachnospiraceae bacterium]|nr:hypothetical protein [Lachnospiraceae bacterium]